jgi:hypothetical protein
MREIRRLGRGGCCSKSDVWNDSRPRMLAKRVATPNLDTSPKTASVSPALRPFLCAGSTWNRADLSPLFRCRNDGGWYVALAKTQSPGNLVQRGVSTLVGRIFCNFCGTRSALTARSRLTECRQLRRLYFRSEQN